MNNWTRFTTVPNPSGIPTTDTALLNGITIPIPPAQYLRECDPKIFGFTSTSFYLSADGEHSRPIAALELLSRLLWLRHGCAGGPVLCTASAVLHYNPAAVCSGAQRRCRTLRSLVSRWPVFGVSGRPAGRSVVRLRLRALQWTVWPRTTELCSSPTSIAAGVTSRTLHRPSAPLRAAEAGRDAKSGHPPGAGSLISRSLLCTAPVHGAAVRGR